MHKNLPSLPVLNRPQQCFQYQPRPESDIAQPVRFRPAHCAGTRVVPWIISFSEYLSFFLSMCPNYVIFFTDLGRCLSVPGDWSTHSFVFSLFTKFAVQISGISFKKHLFLPPLLFSGSSYHIHINTPIALNNFTFVAIVPWFPHIVFSCVVLAYPFASDGRIALLHSPSMAINGLRYA